MSLRHYRLDPDKPIPLTAAILLLLAWFLTSGLLLAAEPFIWIEGENPTKTNYKVDSQGAGRPQFLSEERWLLVNLQANQIPKQQPEEGVVLNYAFDVAQSADHEIWIRIGFEFARSAFDWRLDQGPWKRVTPDDLTTDLMELSHWCEVAWLKLKNSHLNTGSHTLSFRLPKEKDDKGKWRRVLFAFDAACIHPGTFHPYSRYKPGQDHRTEADRAAARQVFVVPEPSDASSRISVDLAGTWEVCRHDEPLPQNVASPMKDLPEAPRWTAINVPSDKNNREDLLFAHRLWYRTLINVPDALQGRSCFLIFPQNNLNTTVLVNGQHCGFDKNPFARVQIDVTPAVKLGVNEILVGIRDAWYGFSSNPNDPRKLRKKFNLPKQFFSEGFQDLAYPIWQHPQSGILVAPQWVVAGPVYAADVFCQPSVAKQNLTLDVTLQNPGSKPLSGQVRCEVVNQKTGQTEKQFEPRPFQLVAGQKSILTLTEPWKNPRLWWPDSPHLYHLRTTVQCEAGTDVAQTTFGFREWNRQGSEFTLNGIPWHVWADCFRASSPDQWLDFYKQNHQTTMRFWGTKWMGLPPEQALAFFDANGVVCRRSGMLDGQRIGNMAVEKDPDLQKIYGSEIKIELMKNWLDQMVAQVKGERNHPSIMLWSLENEWLYINCLNLWGSLMDQFEAEVVKVSDAVLAVDPTRPTMVDGGGATKNNALPVHGDHYVWDSSMTGYPDLAYEPNPTGGGRGRWIWDQQRPRFLGEDYFIAGHHPELAYIGGEAVFGGKAASLPAAGLMARILTEGYRWAGMGGFHFWMGQNDTDGALYNSFKPRTVFCRDWDWTFGSGQQAKRRCAIFNDTHSPDPIRFEWAITLDGQQHAAIAKDYRIPPGGHKKFDLPLHLPNVASRSEGTLTLKLSVAGQPVFTDVKQISVLPSPKSPKVKNLAVLDKVGQVSEFLRSIGQPFTKVERISLIPNDTKILLIANQSLSLEQSTRGNLAAWTALGRSVVVLEQQYPLKYQALPCQMDADANEGRTAFIEDMNHPALQGLKQKDLFTWAPGSVVYQNAYFKPARGAKSLVQCGTRLEHSALAEVPVGKGAMLLCQLAVGENIAEHPTAQSILTGLLRSAQDYKQEFLPVTAAVPAGSPIASALENMGLNYTAVPQPLQALTSGKIALISATPANLKMLTARLAQIRSFTHGGGWIVLHELTPDGLDDFNTLVGVTHVIRPFRRERVSFPIVKNRLTAGLTIGNVALYASEKIFAWQAGYYVADDTFRYVLDYDEIAPFARVPSDYFFNMVNGMVSADAWKYIFSFELKRGDKPEWDMAFPKEEEFIEWTWIGNGFYHLVTQVDITFDGGDTIRFDTKPNTEPQTFAINPPRKAKTLRLKIADWQPVPGKNDVVGVDNLSFKVKRSSEFYQKVKPMLNLGALIEYPQGQGGIILCNVAFQENESPPINAAKKQAILATILRNLKAPFAGKSVIAGANLTCHPLDLSDHANAFRDAKGWFGNTRFTFKDLPTGRQTFAGVQYQIYDFATSPVPTVLMLSDKASRPASEIRGITVNRKADALFFLHTMRLDRRMNDNDRKNNKVYETLRYVVTYADDQSVSIPIHAEIDIHHYRQKEPTAIPGAQIAWAEPFAGTDETAVAYAKQWNNPRPDVMIRSIDMLPGEQPRGVPALLAVTATTAE